MSRLSETPSHPSPVRRKLLRAGFGVPVVATVASGSALAATSATCFARQLGSPTFPGVTSGGDSYLRVQLGRFLHNGTKAITYYVDGQNLAGLAPKLIKSASFALNANQFWLFDCTNNVLVGASAVNATPSGGTYTRKGERFAALRFDATGQIVGVGMSSLPGQSAVAESCWSSAAP